jgi:hypothetical protein
MARTADHGIVRFRSVRAGCKGSTHFIPISDST